MINMLSFSSYLIDLPKLRNYLLVVSKSTVLCIDGLLVARVN